MVGDRAHGIVGDACRGCPAYPGRVREQRVKASVATLHISHCISTNRILLLDVVHLRRLLLLLPLLLIRIKVDRG